MRAKTSSSRQHSLTPKQQCFVEEYLIDLNAKQAAIRAGYSPATAEQQASRLLSNVKVSKVVKAAIEKRSERTGITADRVVAELAKIGFSDIRKAIRWFSQANVASVDGDGDMEAMIDTGEVRFAVQNQVELISSSDIDDDTAAAIAEVGMTDKGTLKVKLHDKRAALVDLGRHLGIFNDKLNLSGDITVVVNKP